MKERAGVERRKSSSSFAGEMYNADPGRLNEADSLQAEIDPCPVDFHLA